MGFHLTTSLRRLSVAACTLFAVLFCVSTASAATYTVTSTLDTISGDCTSTTCSLRDAITAANNSADDDVINVPAGDYALTLIGAGEDFNTTGDLDIQASGRIEIHGAGARSTTVDATALGNDRVFNVTNPTSTRPAARAAATEKGLFGEPVQRSTQARTSKAVRAAANPADFGVVIDGLTVTGGNINTNGNSVDSNGGGISVNTTATVLMTDLFVDNNQSLASTLAFGGGIDIANSDGTTIENTTFANNRTSTAGSGLQINGAVSLVNTTFANNLSDSSLTGSDSGIGSGGALYLASGTAQLDSVTVANNQSRAGGLGVIGIGITANDPEALTGNNVIVANNTTDTPGPASTQCSAFNGPFVVFGTNLDTDSSCFSGDAALHVDPQLGTLSNNGGQTDTIALATGSPAVDAGSSVAGVTPTTDQRGLDRPQGRTFDIGSFELDQDEADVAVSGVGNPQSVNTGDTVTYTYTVTNSGDTATGVKFASTLPNGLSYVSGTTSQGTCTPGVSCELGTLTAGSSATVAIVAKADTAGTYAVTAAATADQYDRVATNNSVTLNTQVNTPDNGTTSPTEPTSTTVKPGVVRQHSAIFRGTVDPKGSPTTVYFEYGTDQGYGSRTENQQVSGSSPLEVSALVDGLQLGKTYHYRVVSVNAAGITYGADQTFRTQGRLKPSKVTIKVSPSRDKKFPYAFVTTGRISVPTGVSSADACRGFVTIAVKRSTSTVSSRRARVKSDCTFKSSVSFKRYNARRSGTLKVQTTFAGNDSLLRQVSKRATVRFGK